MVSFVTSLTGSNVTSGNTAGSEASPLEQEHRVRVITYVVILGVVIFSGLVLNVVALVVLVRSPSLRRTTTARYLVALTIADSACLTGNYATTFLGMGVRGLELNRIQVLIAETDIFDNLR